MTFGEHMWWSAVGAAIGAVVFVGCGYDPRYDAKVQCPEAVKAGIQGPGLVPCWIRAAHDRKREFMKTNEIKATCEGYEYVTCSGVTKSGEPVKFKCDGHGCEYIARWAW